MNQLKDRIMSSGKIMEGNVLSVAGFLNHQVDAALLNDMGGEIHRRFSDEKITKVLTLETSGIPFAFAVASCFNVPMIYAKKSISKNLSADLYKSSVESFTHGRVYDIVVSKEFLNTNDNILIADDFLATGNALSGLMDIISQSGAALAGIAIAIEKGFQGGGDKLRGSGIRLESLAIISSLENGLSFR